MPIDISKNTWNGLKTRREPSSRLVYAATRSSQDFRCRAIGKAIHDRKVPATSERRSRAQGRSASVIRTLQEFLALKRLVPQVRPDIVVLQFFSNDWMNNNAVWESTSIEFEERIRPYYNLRTNRVEFEFPWYHPFTILLRSSALVGWITGKTTEILYQFYPHASFEPNEEFHQARFRESIDVTSHLLRQFARYVGRQSKLFAFNCAENNQHEYFKKIATENGFYVMDGAARHLESYNNSHITTRSRSDHFNEYGNHLLGEWLAENLVKEWEKSNESQEWSQPISNLHKQLQTGYHIKP